MAAAAEVAVRDGAAPRLIPPVAAARRAAARAEGAADVNTFPALPGKYVARLVVTPATGTPTVLEQSFALTRIRW